MSFLMQCPFCPAQIQLPELAHTATCPKCAKTFPALRPEEADAVVAEKAVRDGRTTAAGEEPDLDVSAERLLPPWVSLWGFTAVLLGGVALLLALFLGVRWLTIALELAGILAVGVGIVTTATKRRDTDGVWLAAGGALNLALLGLTLIAPGMLNRYWGMDDAVPLPDPHKLVALSDQPGDTGRDLTPADVADAVTESIGQDGVSLRIMAVAVGELADRGPKPFLLIRIRLSNVGYQRAVTFAGFRTDQHRPALRADSGESYAFLEQRARKLPAGGIVFLAAAPQTVDIQPTRFLDFQLVFEAHRGEFSALTLELPASAWGRKGVCKYRIERFFEPDFPVAKKS